MVDNKTDKDPLKLKGRLFTLTVIELPPTKISDFKCQIESLYNKAPNMFTNAPIVLDLKPLKGTAFDIKGVAEVMREFQMVPVAVQHASVIQQKAAAAAGLAVFSSKDGNESKPLEKAVKSAESGEVVSNSIKHRSTAEVAKPALEKSTSASQLPMEPLSHNDLPTRISKVITQPVRSGQQIYAKGADLIVLASVGTGAELLADGHIHVYGTLRGRALAGLNGDKHARIFCSQLKAELVSIAGQYLTLDAHDVMCDKAKQIHLANERVQIVNL